MKVKEIIFIVEEDPGGGFTPKALGESIFTEADTLGELRENIKDALRCHFDRAEEIPNIVRLHIVRERPGLPTLLCKSHYSLSSNKIAIWA